MGRTRFLIGRLMLGVVLLAVPMALLANTMNGHALTGGNRLTDMGLWPGLVAFGAASFSLARRRKERLPFLWGFTVTGWAALLAYVALCLSRNGWVEMPIGFYLNDLGEWGFDWLTDLDTYEGYALNLLVLGLFLASPQLILAIVGGFLTRLISGARWSTT